MQTSVMLSGKNIAVLMTDGAEEQGYWHMRGYVEERGATVTTVAPKSAGCSIQMYDHRVAASEVEVLNDLNGADAETFDALLLPGGLLSQVWLRLTPSAMTFIGAFGLSGKPVLAIDEATTLVRCGGVCAVGLNRPECLCRVAHNLATAGPASDISALEDAFAEQLVQQ